MINVSNSSSILVSKKLDDVVKTVYNEPSLGLYFTQQHIHNSFPLVLSQLDKLHENRKKLESLINEVNTTEREVKEITGLTGDFAFNMLTKISSINYKLSQLKNK